MMLICQSCKREVPRDSKYCPYCGNKNDRKTDRNFFKKFVTAFGSIAAILFMVSGFISLDHISKADLYTSDILMLIHITCLSFAFAFFTVTITTYMIYKIIHKDS